MIYEDLIGDWKDPWPDPVLKEHDGFVVVRDDLLKYGSKVRFADYLIGDYSPKITEWVYGSCPAQGYAQISLPVACKLHDKTTTLFMAKRNEENYTDYQRLALKLGANIQWVENGMLTVTTKRARDYAEQEDYRQVIPIGLEHDTVFASIIKVARNLPYKPKEIWTVGSSGTLNRGLQMAFPDAECHVVSVGHKMSPREIGRAKFWRSEIPFHKPAIILPPFPSALNYDAKLWEFVKKHASPGALIWNVGG